MSVQFVQPLPPPTDTLQGGGPMARNTAAAYA